MNENKQEGLTLGLSIAAIILSVAALFVSLNKTTSQGVSMGVAGINAGTEIPSKGTPADFYRSKAKELGVSNKSFDKCIADPEMKARVEADSNEAAALGGTGTPFNVIQAPDGTLYPVAGAYPQEFFEQIIDGIMAGNVELPEDFVSPDKDLIRDFDPKEDHYKGSKNADIVIYEFSDFECPFCSRVHPTLNNVIEKYDNVAWVYRHLPLNFHPQAMPSAIASECIAEEEGNDAFWSFADTIYADQSLLK